MGEIPSLNKLSFIDLRSRMHWRTHTASSGDEAVCIFGRSSLTFWQGSYPVLYKNERKKRAGRTKSQICYYFCIQLTMIDRYVRILSTSPRSDFRFRGIRVRKQGGEYTYRGLLPRKGSPNHPFTRFCSTNRLRCSFM